MHQWCVLEVHIVRLCWLKYWWFCWLCFAGLLVMIGVIIYAVKLSENEPADFLRRTYSLSWSFGLSVTSAVICIVSGLLATIGAVRKWQRQIAMWNRELYLPDGSLQLTGWLVDWAISLVWLISHGRDLSLIISSSHIPQSPNHRHCIYFWINFVCDHRLIHFFHSKYTRSRYFEGYHFIEWNQVWI